MKKQEKVVVEDAEDLAAENEEKQENKPEETQKKEEQSRPVYTGGLGDADGMLNRVHTVLNELVKRNEAVVKENNKEYVDMAVKGSSKIEDKLSSLKESISNLRVVCETNVAYFESLRQSIFTLESIINQAKRFQ